MHGDPFRKTPVADTPYSLRPITLERVGTPEEGRIRNVSVDHHHHLGYRHPFNFQIEVLHHGGPAARPGVPAVRGNHPEPALP